MNCITAVRSQADEAIEPSTGQHPAGFFRKNQSHPGKKTIQLKSFWLFASFMFIYIYISFGKATKDSSLKT